MPELPEVETVVQALRHTLIGRTLLGVRCISKLRLPCDERETAGFVKNRSIINVRRRAKYIVIDVGDNRALLGHLGMTGYFHMETKRTPLSLHDRMAFILDGGEELRYADARRFGYVIPVCLGADGWPEQLADLGVEPLERACSATYMMARAEKRTAPVKNFIMDQAIIAGVGNIYASEALFEAKIDPRRQAGSLSKQEWTRLVKEIKTVLRRAVKAGGSTIRNYRTVDGTEGDFQRVLKVYGKDKEPCPRCGKEVQLVRLGGRSSFYCPKCQN